MDYAKLDKLIKIEKKSDASKEKKNDYCIEMTRLLEEEGYSQKTEYYLLKGFAFSGAKPLTEYMNDLSTEDQNKIFDEIVTSKNYRENNNCFGFKLSVSLLAQVINIALNNYEVLKTLIRNIVMFSKTREKKLRGDAYQTFDRFFVSVLDLKCKLPDLDKLGLSKSIHDEFISILSICLNQIKADNKITKTKIYALKEWIKVAQSQNEKVREIEPKVIDDISVHKENNVNKEQKNETKEIAKEEAKENISNTQSEKQDTAFPMDANDLYSLANFLKANSNRIIATADHIKSLEKGFNTLNRTNDELTKKNENYKQEISNAENKNKELLSKLAKSESDKNLLSADIYSLKKDIEAKNHTIEELNAEIEKMKSVLSVYSTDKENSKSEQLNQIASKLKSDYIDFMEAENEEMTPELGENFRYQIKSIFKILAKSGINVGGR